MGRRGAIGKEAERGGGEVAIEGTQGAVGEGGNRVRTGGEERDAAAGGGGEAERGVGERDRGER